jgi:actin
METAIKTADCYASYYLPDGNVITIAEERFRCAELLFTPSLGGFDYDGVHQSLIDSIMRCDIDLHRDLCANIVLSGGSTMFPGFPERLEKDIIGLTPSQVKVKVIAPPHRENSAWLGGSILACLAQFPEMVITREEYNDSGPRIVHRKCFM